MSFVMTSRLTKSRSIPPLRPSARLWGHAGCHAMPAPRAIVPASFSPDEHAPHCTLLHLEPCRSRPASNDGQSDRTMVGWQHKGGVGGVGPGWTFARVRYVSHLRRGSPENSPQHLSTWAAADGSQTPP